MNGSVQHQRGGSVGPNQAHVITMPPPEYSSSVRSYGAKENDSVAKNNTMPSGMLAYEELLEDFWFTSLFLKIPWSSICMVKKYF